MATPQDLSVTKQHRNDRWDRCTASDGDWQIITTTSHRSANQRYFMHNSATVHRMRMPSLAFDSSCSQLCNDTSTGVVRHQITKWRRLQNVVSYRVLHHKSCIRSLGLLHRCFPKRVAWPSATARATKQRSSFRHDCGVRSATNWALYSGHYPRRRCIEWSPLRYRPFTRQAEFRRPRAHPG